MNTNTNASGPMKLQKYLSSAGVCSRRKAEEYIRAGQITVNGVKAHIGQIVDPNVDVIKYSDQVVQDAGELVYYAFHKPRGVVTSCADTHEKDILDVVDIPERVFPVGRLDKNTTGLVLLTNDGRITHRLLHPSFDHEKEYLVEVYGKISDEQLKRMESGLTILGKKTKRAVTKRVSTGTFRIILTEGRNRQIRRMVEAVGLEVKRLKRLRIENIDLGKLPIGEYRPLSKKEIQGLFDRIGFTGKDFEKQPSEPINYPFISWVVVHGDGLGKKLGFPTANLEFSDADLPNATYFVWAHLDGHTYPAAGVYLPWKGTFEVHILDFDADIYGKNLEVDIVDKIRDNQKFDDAQELTHQIQKDIQTIRHLISGHGK